MIMDMAFLQTLDVEIAVGVAVAIVMSAIFVLSFRKPKGCLDPENFKEFKLVKCVQLSHNVAKFTFALPTPTSVLGLPIGQHISCKGKDSQGEDVIKPYTPTTLDSDVGHFELVIKDECPIIFERCVLVIIFLLKDPRDVLDINMARLEHLVCLLEDLELLQCSKLLGQYWKTQKTGRRFTSSMPMLNMRTLF